MEIIELSDKVQEFCESDSKYIEYRRKNYRFSANYNNIETVTGDLHYEDIEEDKGQTKLVLDSEYTNASWIKQKFAFRYGLPTEVSCSFDLKEGISADGYITLQLPTPHAIYSGSKRISHVTVNTRQPEDTITYRADREMSTNVSVPPKSKVKASMSVSEKATHKKFYGHVLLSGEVKITVIDSKGEMVTSHTEDIVYIMTQIKSEQGWEVNEKNVTVDISGTILYQFVTSHRVEISDIKNIEEATQDIALPVANDELVHDDTLINVKAATSNGKAYRDTGSTRIKKSPVTLHNDSDSNSLDSGYAAVFNIGNQPNIWANQTTKKPKQRRRNRPRRFRGTCKWSSTELGYGFITPDDESDDVFVHYSVIQMDGFKMLRRKEYVEYTYETTYQGREAALVCAPGGGDCTGERKW